MRCFLVCILLFSIFSARSQTEHTIEGHIVDSLKHDVVGAVITCSLQDKMIAVTTSDMEGFFKVRVVSDSCVIKITHIQYQEIAKMLQLDRNLDLGQIVMSENVNTVTSVVIMADFIKRKGADYTVSLRNNPVAVNHNTLEFLNTLPGVTGLQINGRGVSTVYVNGRQLHLPPAEVMQYLAGLQATDVENISILPSGGAKYAADHKGGVIRIQLRRGDDRLFSGSTTLPVGVNTEDGAISTDIPLTLNYTTKKLASSTYISGSYLQNEKTENTYRIDDRIERSFNSRMYYTFSADQSFIYDINKKHSLGIAVNAQIKPKESSVFDVLTELDGINSNQTSRINDRISRYQGEGVVTYQWNIDDKGSVLHVAGDYLYTSNKSDMSYAPSDAEVEYTFSDTKKNTFAVEADGEIYFNDERSSLNLGAKYLQMNAAQDYLQSTLPENQFRYNERIFSAYAEFNTSFADDKIDFSAGLRYEGAGIKWNYKDEVAGRMDSKDRFDNWFPSASLTYNMPSGKSYLSLEYERSISRPIMSDYDPVAYRESENIYTIGAAHLQPEFEHVVSLTQTLNQRHTFSVSYTWNNNLYDVLYQKENDALVITSGNVGSSRTLQFFAQTRFWIIKDWLQGKVSGTAEYVAFNHSTYGKTRAWQGDVNAGVGLTLPKGWFVNLSGSYSPPITTPTEKITAYWSLNAAVGKQLGKRLMMYVSGSNLLYNKHQTITSRQPEVNFMNRSRNYFQNITLSLTYRFGSPKLSYVKRAKSSGEVKSRSSDNN